MIPFGTIATVPACSARWIAAPCLLLVLTACGGGQTALSSWLGSSDDTGYAKHCSERTASQQADLASGAYNPAILFTHEWPAAARTGAELLMPESRLVGSLEQGDVRRLLVIARGGLGKTRLAESIEAQSCGTLPVFTVDLKQVAAAKGTDNAVLSIIAKNLGLEGKAQARADFEGKLGRQRWLLFLDAIEEVDLTDRPAVMAQVQDLGKRFPSAQVALLARPPVLDDDYGFADIDARLEIPPLECAVSDAFVARSHKADDDRRLFQGFLHTYGLDEKGRFGLQCSYPYLSTYRDIQTLSDFEAKSRAGDPAFLASRAAVYEALIAARLKKEFAQLGWTVAEGLDMIDRLVRAQTVAGGQRNLVFDLGICQKAIDAKWGDKTVDAGVGGNDESRRRQVCEKTFQSALFSQTEGKQAWAFSDSATSDLMLARWLGGEIARGPAGDCSAVTRNGELLAAPGVTQFFAGQPAGQHCVAHVAAALCNRQIPTSVIADNLDRGLPVGAARAQSLKDARAMASGLQPKACVAAVLDGLDKMTMLNAQ